MPKSKSNSKKLYIFGINETAISRNLRRRIFPLGFLGISLTKTTRPKCFCRDTRSKNTK